MRRVLCFLIYMGMFGLGLAGLVTHPETLRFTIFFALFGGYLLWEEFLKPPAISTLREHAKWTDSAIADFTWKYGDPDEDSTTTHPSQGSPPTHPYGIAPR